LNSLDVPAILLRSYRHIDSRTNNIALAVDRQLPQP